MDKLGMIDRLYTYYTLLGYKVDFLKYIKGVSLTNVCREEFNNTLNKWGLIINLCDLPRMYISFQTHPNYDRSNKVRVYDGKRATDRKLYQMGFEISDNWYGGKSANYQLIYKTVVEFFSGS